MPAQDLRTANFDLPLIDDEHELEASRVRLNEAVTTISLRLQEIVNQTQSPDAGTLGGQDLAFVLSLANAIGILPVSKGGTGATTAEGIRTSMGFDAAWDVKFAAALNVAPEQLNTIQEIVAEIQDNDSAIAAINTVLASKAAQTALDAVDTRVTTAETELDVVLPDGASGTFTYPRRTTAQRDALDMAGKAKGYRIRHVNIDPAVDRVEEWDGVSAWDAAGGGGDVSKLDLLLMQMQISDGVNRRVGFAGSYADDLHSSTSFDASASDDATHLGVAIPVDEADDALPVFTTFTNGAFTVSAQTSYPGYPAWQAADSSDTTFWIPGNTGTSWWRVDCGISTVASVIEIKTGAGANGDWIFQGSDSADSGYVDLATKPAEGGSGKHTVTLAAPVSYRYYRLWFPTATNGATTLGNISILSTVRQQDARIVIEEYDVGTPPSSLYVLLACTIGGTPTLNTDISASLSRDDGTTWTAGTLTQIGSSSDGVTYLEMEVDVSAQPSGQLASLKIETANYADLVLEGLVMRWT